MAEPTDEIQEILNFLLPYAEQMLNEHGEFYPYAAALDAEGELERGRRRTSTTTAARMSASFWSRSTRACASGRPRARSARPGSRRT